MSPADTPRCLAIIICEGVVEDAQSRNKCILNTFNNIWAARFPVAHDRLTVFASLTNGQGEMPLEVRFVQERKPEPLLVLTGAIRFPGPQEIVDLTVNLRQIPIPEPGPYVVQLWMNQKLIGERGVNAKLIPQQEPKP